MRMRRVVWIPDPPRRKRRAEAKTADATPAQNKPPKTRRRQRAILYVGNLARGTIDTELREVFAAAGTVLGARVVTRRLRRAGRTRLHAFVEMSTIDEAFRAFVELNGRDFKGRTLVIRESKNQGWEVV